MSDDAILEAIKLYRETLEGSEALYAQAATAIRDSYVWVADQEAMSAAEQMHDLHHGLVMKVYAWVAPDGAQSLEQRQLARVLLSHIWNKPVMGTELHAAIAWLIDAAEGFQWESLVKPFLDIPELRDEYGQLMSLVMRMGNLVARADGDYSPEETERLASLQQTFDLLGEGADAGPLKQPPRTPAPASRSGSIATKDSKRGSQEPRGSSPPGRRPPTSSPPSSSLPSSPASGTMHDALAWLRAEAERLRATADTIPEPPAPSTPPASTTKSQPATKPTTQQQQHEEAEDQRTPEERLAEAREKLNGLIGLENIKHQVETLTNFLKMERLRAAEGLPTTQPSLHMSFVGNPGTGKTTVARIVADIYGALGILQKGHLVETDRTGLVAEYAGQTGPKTNAKIDEALDGVLFIDEAYTLIDTGGQDQYGREAVQTLLKRMEDQRDRLVVILAGYPVEMEMMIRSNPGLSSRVGTTLEFDDYTPGEMARIFGLMAKKAEYQLPTETRRRLLYGFDYLFDRRDRHFGNGRTVRNSFERSVRRLANRLAGLVDVNRDLLTTLQPEDIEVAGLEQAHLAALAAQHGHVLVPCDHCKKEITISDQQLAVEIPCPSCQQEFIPQWGEIVVVAPAVPESASDPALKTPAEVPQSSSSSPAGEEHARTT